MNTIYAPQLRNRKRESLQTQREFLDLLRRRHMNWMDSANDPDVKLLHLDIADLLHKITDQYGQLLAALEDQREEE
ncbi:MAG TPA: hypothetical protein VJ821_05045 [Anaerolineales bacterium]|nr:hypothetical protein [Anaerolineales bacterium]